MRKQLGLIGRNQGRITKSQIIIRQAEVEKLMKMGYGVTKIASMTLHGKKLGALDTISKDMDIIHSRWLASDLEWFHRASIARIEAKQRLLEQMTRLGDLILSLNGMEDSEKTLVYTESQLTTVISKIYDIDADFDPEQYIDKKIQESINVKIKKAETTTS